MRILNRPVQFAQDRIEVVEDKMKAKFVCDTEHEGVLCSVFYGEEAHPVSGSRYFALYYNRDRLMISNASWIEEQEIAALMDPKTRDVIFSCHRHDCRVRGEMMIDGGRHYTRRSVYGFAVILIVRDGILKVNEEE